MLGVVEEASMEAVHAAAVGVPLQHHGLHVVEQHFPRHATERHECVLVAADQRLDTLVVTELHVGHATPAEGGNEYRKTIRATAHRRPVCLHLLAGLCLEPDDRFSHWLRK